MDYVKIIQKIEGVTHPAIDAPLTTLGILQDIDFENDKVKATIVWPFDTVPPAIKQNIVSGLKNAVEPFGLTFEYNEKMMNEKEKEKFLVLEKKYWKGS